jgi:hypothetical protein
MPTAFQLRWSDNCREAAKERIAASLEMYRQNRLVEANYFAGLAVECVLRGYRVLISAEFDARHDLSKLFDLARFVDIIPHAAIEKMTAAMGDVISLWSNDHRFLSEFSLRKKWTRSRLFRGIKGDFVKERTWQLINAAEQIVSLGVARWKH